MKQECDGCSLSRLSLEMCNDANSTNLEVKMEQQQLSHVSLISSASPRWVRERSALPTELDSWTDGRTKQRGRSDPFTGSDGGGSGVAGNSGVGRTDDGRTDGGSRRYLECARACGFRGGQQQYTFFELGGTRRSMHLPCRPRPPPGTPSAPLSVCGSSSRWSSSPQCSCACGTGKKSSFASNMVNTRRPSVEVSLSVEIFCKK